jgi:aminoglycoside phosphotransferase
VANLAPAQRFARRELTGHSGDTLCLIQMDDRSFVRKQAGSPARAKRLALQCEKLRHAHEHGIACPSVYRAGMSDGAFSFDMEFVPAESLAHSLMTGQDVDWKQLLLQLTALLKLYQASSGNPIPDASFVAKLDNIAANCRTNVATAHELLRIHDVVSRLKAFGWNDVPRSECHGDLTLENILLRQDGTAVFIDFDVPDQSSWWLDIAKLFQDLYGHWCLRDMVLSNPDRMAVLNAQLAMSRAASVIEPTLAGMVPGGMTRLRPLVAFHLLRTLPYAHSPLIVDYVLRRIATILDG